MPHRSSLIHCVRFRFASCVALRSLPALLPLRLRAAAPGTLSRDGLGVRQRRTSAGHRIDRGRHASGAGATHAIVVDTNAADDAASACSETARSDAAGGGDTATAGAAAAVVCMLLPAMGRAVQSAHRAPADDSCETHRAHPATARRRSGASDSNSSPARSSACVIAELGGSSASR